MGEQMSQARAIGWWQPGGQPLTGDQAIATALAQLHQPVALVRWAAGLAVGPGGVAVLGGPPPSPEALPLLGYTPPLLPEQLGDGQFRAEHGLRYAYVQGAMANGIASVELVEAMSRAGCLGFFGAAGLAPTRIESAIDRLTTSLGSRPFGFNLIHSPGEQDLEAAVVDLYLRRGIRLVEASAFLDLTPHVVRYRVTGLHRDADGRVVAPNRVVAKVSRVEVAAKFLSPPPEKMLRELVAAGKVSAEEAALARFIPMAQDVSVEADSGGHTDNRPAITLLPTMIALRDRLQAEHRYAVPPRIGLGGGIATPTSAAAAFAMGAAYVLTGSINQACVESGTSDKVRQMLAQAEQADTIMAPAADMFEMGVKVQVLKRGTMFAMRAAKLYELYRAYPSIDALPEAERTQLEKTIFRASLEEIWRQTVEFFKVRDPRQIERANADPKHKMALIFRWYLGNASRWANSGEPTRQLDYQIWCGPAMGAFNEWTRDSILQEPTNRSAVVVAMNLLAGAAVTLRANLLRCQGAVLAPEATRFAPRSLAELRAIFGPPGEVAQ